MGKEYFAFISYKSEDVEWAIWVQHELEHYHLPASYNGRADVPQKLRPVFRDIDELSAGNLPEQIKRALTNSQNLIVICSPQAATSPWVNQEVETFISLGRTDRIFPFIVEGNSPKEFFPPALLNLPKNEERLGGDVSKNGRDAAFVKVVAGMLGVGFDSLWNRYEKEKAEEERKQREQRDRLLISQSRFLAEKANSLVEEGDSYTAKLLALEALPKDLKTPNRPYVPEAEAALRSALFHRRAVIKTNTMMRKAIFGPDNVILAHSPSETVLWLGHSGVIKYFIKGGTGSHASASFSPNGERILATIGDSILIWDTRLGQSIKTINPYEAFNSFTRVFYYSSYNQTGDFFVTISNSEKLNTFNLSVWDAKSYELVNSVEDSLIGRFADISPSNNLIVTANIAPKNICDHHYGEDHLSVISIWNMKTLKCVNQFEAHTEIINSVQFSSDGKHIVSSSVDKTIKVWDAVTGEECCTLAGHTSAVNHAAFSSNGQFVISSSDDRSIKIWDWGKKQCIKTFLGHQAPVQTAFMNDEDSLIISSSDDCSIRIWEFNSQYTEKGSLSPIKRGILPFADANAKKRLLATASPTSLNHVEIWDLDELMLKGILRHRGPINDVSFNLSGDILATTSKDYSLKLWDSESLSCISTLDGFDNPPECLMFNENHSLLLISTYNESNQGEVIAYDVKSMKEMYSLRTDKTIASMAITEDNTLMALGGIGDEDRTISIFNLLSGECLSSFGESKVWIESLCFRHDGKKLLSISGRNVELWDISSGCRELSLFGNKAIFVNGGNWLCVVTPEYKIVIKDIATQVTIFEKNIRKFPVIKIIDLPESEKLAIIYRDGIMEYLNTTSLQQLINETREQFKNRYLTPEERRKYYLE